MADLHFLVPKIREILCSPSIDLTTISAKRVRKQLLILDASIEPDFIRENKAELDIIIGTVFEEVQNGSYQPDLDIDPGSIAHESSTIAEPDQTRPIKRKRSPSTPQPSPPARGKNSRPNGSRKKNMTDEEYARQLDSQLNSIRTRGASAGSSGRAARKSTSKSPKKVRKSKVEVEDDSEAEDDGDQDGAPLKKKKKKTTGNGGAKGGFQKEYVLSEPLADLLDVTQLSRPQVVKRLWDYIKVNELQNPRNKQEILSDAKFRAVFNLDKVGMFQMSKLLGAHLHPLDG